MSIYVIADLHLSFHENKPMDIFGDNWEDHSNKIKEDWETKVKPSDIVVLPGDFSWSMHLKETYEDFKYLNDLPGKKILLKGNHDYYWTTIANMRKFLKENNFETIDFLYNNAYEYENTILVGTRGWSEEEGKDNLKIFAREQMRLERSIEYGIKNFGNDKEIIAFMHYPPITQNDILKNERNDWIKILSKYNIKKCYYGHLHGKAIDDAIEGEYFGIDFKLVSSDALNFNLLKISS